jgi:hypothetical protein
VTVSPSVGTPDTAFHVTARVIYPIVQSRDMYRFKIGGPGGEGCTGREANIVGITPPRRAKWLSIDMPGLRGQWCPGFFRGKGEFRDYRPGCRCFVRRPVGTFTVRVRPTGT